MRWRRHAPWLAVVTAGVAAVAVLPAVSWGSEQPPGAATGFDGADQAAGNTPLVAAVARDLQLNEAQAAARLRKDAWATRTEARLRRELGGSFGGAWITAGGGALTVAVTSEAAAQKVRASGATPKPVGRNEESLNGLKARLDSVGADASVTGWHVEVSSNTVVITAKPDGVGKAQALVARAGVPADAVRVVTSTDTPRPLIDVRGGDPYFIERQFRCSVGFAVQGGFVTAGHCGAVGDTTQLRQANGTTVEQGVVRRSTFPGDGDFGFVQTNANFTGRAVVAQSDGRQVPVAGATEAPVGAAICRTGSTTGTRCGVVQAKNQTVRYPEGAVTGLTRTNVCAEGGDSGGSWISGDQAQGVTSGGSGNCTAGGTTFFQPLTEILQATGTTLVTSGGTPTPTPSAGSSTRPPTAPPSSSAPPAGGCAGLANNVSGSLAAAGAQQIQPDGRFFRARSGRQQACLSGPEGANFDLVLQRWNGRRWQTVAGATGPTAQETLSFDGRAGFYRYGVLSVAGSGIYTLGVNIP